MLDDSLKECQIKIDFLVSNEEEKHNHREELANSNRVNRFAFESFLKRENSNISHIS